jgi:hypothetical protein
LEVQGVNNAVESDAKDRFTSETIRFLLLALAFITPYMLSLALGPVTSILLTAPLWRYGTTEYPVFRIWPMEYLIITLPFGLVRLAFIRQVLLYKKQLTTFTTLVLAGILCELPGPVFGVAFGRGWIHFPFPLFLIVGLLLARYSSKEPLSWIEVEER